MATIPPGGAPGGQRVLHLSCLWADLADTLVDGQGRSWLPCHQVVPWSPTRWRFWRAKSAIPRALILRERSEQCLPRALNERATRVMGRWRLSKSVILPSKLSSVCWVRWMSEQWKWLADDACHGWFCASRASLADECVHSQLVIYKTSAGDNPGGIFKGQREVHWSYFRAPVNFFLINCIVSCNKYLTASLNHVTMSVLYKAELVCVRLRNQVM